MTMKTIRQRTALLLAPIGAMFGVAFAISWLGNSGVAAAHTLQVAVPDAATAVETNQIIDLLLSGKYLVAVGLLMPPVVGALRYGLGKLSPWFATTIGGVVTAYGSTVLLYLGAAWATGAPFDVRLLLLALASGMAASGAWQHVKDLIGGAKSVAKATTGSLLVLVASGSVLVGCATVRPVAADVVTAELDCTSGALVDVVKSLGNTAQVYLYSKIAGDDRTVDTAAIRADLRILASKAWTCAVTVALGVLLDRPAARTLADVPGPDWRAVLVDVKAELGVSTVRTHAGVL
jgi:hypothetical protein